MLVSVVLAAGVTGCTSGDRVDDASITVSPAIALMDQPVRVSMAGLRADHPATVTATAKDVVGVTWSSSAEFRASADGTLSFTRKRSSWTLDGRELPFAPAGQFGAPAAEVDPKTYVPVDRIRGPILLACGELDLEWPSCRNVDDIIDRIKGRQGVSVLRYRDAGHYIGTFPPYTSTTDEALSRTGGTITGIEVANLDLHTKVLALLASL